MGDIATINGRADTEGIAEMIVIKTLNESLVKYHGTRLGNDELKELVKYVKEKLDAVVEVTEKRGTTEVELLEYDEEWEINIYRCKKCGYATIFEGNNFCAKCRAEINWEPQRLEEQRQREQRKKNGYRPGVYAEIKDTQV